MKVHLLYFRLLGARRFEKIHGGAVTRAARADLARRFSAAARALLRQHAVVSGTLTPEFGVWAIAFELKRLEIESDEREQLESITAAASELAGPAFAGELGSAVALHARFEAGVIDVKGGARDPALWLHQLQDFLRRARPQRGEPTAEERRTVLGIIARPLEVRLQEIVALDTRRPMAYESLLRGPVGSPLREPERLLSQAARCGLRAELELASFEAALKLAPCLPSDCRLAINLSPDLYGEPAVQRLSSARGLPEGLILEITEHLPIAAPARLAKELAPLRRRGVMLALDDAGCGYLNMELVRALKPDIVKLCITVTRRIGGGSAIIASIKEAVSTIRAEGAAVLAEGVESEAQARLARECGCTLAQGFHFGKPRSVSAVIPEAAVSRR